MPPWGAALALLLAAFALLGLLAALLRRPGRRAVGARTLPGAQGQDHEEEVDGAGPADQFSDGREPLPGGCRLICKPSALAQCLLRALRRSTALEPGPRSWLSGPHLQTLCHFVLPVGPGSDLAREYLQLADDGLVALDWVVGPCARGRRVTNAGGLPAVLLVIPNAWGRLTRNVLGLCLLALERGYYPVIFHRRGHHGCPLVSPRLQPFGDPSDLKEAITYIRFRHPAAPLFAVSEGSGSALLLSYLGECGSSSYMTGAACISPVLCCREWFEAGLPWPYERGFLLHQKIALSRYATALEDTVDTGKLFRSRSLREFEETLFCHTKSFPISWDTYWDHNDPLRDVDEAAVPVLCICSADDPVCGPPNHFLPTELFHSNPYFFLLLSRHGGHCGFLRQEPLPAWSHEVILEYFRALTEFFRTEERMKGLSRRRASFLGGRRRWGTLPKRGVSPSSNLEEIFSWKRSYTR
ncbi:protein ABHD15 isoform X1 [Balaenoptera musculus]|uniref:Protein ABHD15 n=1 Tax=Balaenoptera musculus TaxID=9771 RepID=A0A8B8WCH5_BALMU|nr:protein ABHD15 isoform X1 [Balaenoptera musculus]